MLGYKHIDSLHEEEESSDKERVGSHEQIQDSSSIDDIPSSEPKKVSYADMAKRGTKVSV